MATETVILRPNSSYMAIDVSGNISDNTYPTTKDPSQIWLLLSEEVSDENSTYIKFTSSTSLFRMLTYGFSKPPESYVTTIPNKISLYVQAADMLDKNKYSISTEFVLNDGTTSADITMESDTILNSSYQIIKLECPKENLETVYNLLLNNENGLFRIREKVLNGSSEKNSDVRVTQLYLELEYSDEEDDDNPPTTTPICIKQNGSWNIINSSSIYKKENGVWVLKDISVLQEGLRYKINAEEGV